MKTVIIVDHPSYDTSVVNRRWLDEVRKYPDEFLIHNLQSYYPRSRIDPVVERSLIDNNGAVVFQFPIHWFTCPPMLKDWFDLVLTPDWVQGRGRHLAGRKTALAVTAGAGEDMYQQGGGFGHTLADFLCPFETALRFCKTDFCGIYAFYCAQGGNGSAPEAAALAASARSYVDFLRRLGSAPEQA